MSVFVDRKTAALEKIAQQLKRIADKVDEFMEKSEGDRWFIMNCSSSTLLDLDLRMLLRSLGIPEEPRIVSTVYIGRREKRLSVLYEIEITYLPEEKKK